MSDNHDLDFNEVMAFFDNRFSGDDHKAGWDECKNHVEKYNMEYEVFALAYQKLDKNASTQECIDMISAQMDSWDL